MYFYKQHFIFTGAMGLWPLSDVTPKVCIGVCPSEIDEIGQVFQNQGIPDKRLWNKNIMKN